MTAASGDGRKPQTKECGQSLEVGRGRGTNSALEPSRRMVRLEVSRVAWNHNSIQNMDCEVRLTSVESCLLLLKESSF